MTEVLFVLTVIYVAYVFYVAINDKKAQVKSTSSVAEPEKKLTLVADSPIDSAPEEKAPKTIKTTTKKPTITKQATHKKGLKNPKTGDIVTTYNNYIFTKRWIKDALVAEGLLEKVYKNNELNAEIEADIKVAIAKLEAMEQYKVYN